LCALFVFVRDFIRYQRDVVEAESLSTAAEVLAQGFGDCDDKTVALCAMAGAVGFPTALAALAFRRGGPFTHVIALAWLDDAGWIPLDPTEPHAMGWQPPDARELLLLSNQD
jgi:transglutaminase-like putative cysteine protease